MIYCLRFLQRFAEAAKRTALMDPFDVQFIGSSVLHRGAIAEMRTGEGKTLVAVPAAYLNALTGKPVHVVTVNDYLADVMLYGWGRFMRHSACLSVFVNGQNQSYRYDPGHIEKDTERDETGSFRVVYDFLREVSRQEAYQCDIVYGTNNEYGF